MSESDLLENVVRSAISLETCASCVELPKVTDQNRLSREIYGEYVVNTLKIESKLEPIEGSSRRDENPYLRQQQEKQPKCQKCTSLKDELSDLKAQIEKLETQKRQRKDILHSQNLEYKHMLFDLENDPLKQMVSEAKDPKISRDSRLQAPGQKSAKNIIVTPASTSQEFTDSQYSVSSVNVMDSTNSIKQLRDKHQISFTPKMEDYLKKKVSSQAYKRNKKSKQNDYLTCSPDASGLLFGQTDREERSQLLSDDISYIDRRNDLKIYHSPQLASRTLYSNTEGTRNNISATRSNYDRKIKEKKSAIEANLKALTKTEESGHSMFRYYWYDYLPVYTGARSAILSKIFPLGKTANVMYLFYRVLIWLIIWLFALYKYNFSRKNFWEFTEIREMDYGHFHMYIEHWFMFFYLMFTLTSAFTLIEFHIFNYPLSLITVPNHIIHSKDYWKNKDLIVNYRRDASVIMKWANIFFELSVTFGLMALSYPICLKFVTNYQICVKANDICDGYEPVNVTSSTDSFVIDNGYNINAVDSNTLKENYNIFLTQPNNIIQEVNWILSDMGWIRAIAALIPLEMFISTYRIQFWHIWLVPGIFVLYLLQAFNYVKTKDVKYWSGVSLE